jgi:hypothetical protein
MTQREEKLINILTELRKDVLDNLERCDEVYDGGLEYYRDKLTEALSLLNNNVVGDEVLGGDLDAIMNDPRRDNDDWKGDLDFYDGVQEREERERMEDKGEMEHEPNY